MTASRTSTFSTDVRNKGAMYFRLFGWSAIVLLGGCTGGANLSMNVVVPTPIVSQLPAHVGVFYPPELQNYVFEEEIPNHGTFRMEMQNSHVSLFRTVFGALFEESIPVESFDSQPKNIDALIVPSVKQVQISIPQQTRSNFYEVWIQYSVELYRLDGSLINSWSVPAYGKVNKQNYSGLGESGEALSAAGNWALRDAAATISVYFTKEPAHSSWLATLGPK